MKPFKFTLIGTLIFAIVCLILYAGVFDVWTVPSDDPWLAVSIEPALAAGDIILTSRHETPQRGQLLKCPDPASPDRSVIARFIAQGGEKLSIIGDVAKVDDKKPPSPRGCPGTKLKNPKTGQEIELYCNEEELGLATFRALRAKTNPMPPMQIEVDPNKNYLISDNRHLHLDSRDFGAVDTKQCQHIVFRLWGETGLFDASRRFNIIW